MNPNLVYAKTPLGEQAVRQGTQVVQRNLRMVLLQVDGKLNVADLSAKIGNPRLVESCLQELETAGLVVGTIEVASYSEGEQHAALPQGFAESVEPRSVFSAFVPRPAGEAQSPLSEASLMTGFSSFGDPIEPALTASAAPSPAFPAAGADESIVPRARSGFPWRKALLLVSVVSLLSLLAGMLFYPYERFLPAIEAAAGRLLGAPVKIEAVAVGFWPRPQLKLMRTSIGLAGDGRIAEIRIGSPWTLLGSGAHAISSLKLIGVELNARRLLEMPLVAGGGTAADAGLELPHVQLERVALNLGSQLAVNGASGELIFGTQGQLEKLTLENADRTLLVDAHPAERGIAVSFEGRGWEPGPAKLALGALQADGLLTADKLLVQNVDSTFLGGRLRGNWLLDWSHGLAMAGEGNLSHVDGRQVAAALVPELRLEGDISGAFRLRSSGLDWAGLWKSLEVVLDGEVDKGALHGIDPFEAARRGGGHEVRGGLLRFNRLQFSLTASPKQAVARSVIVDAGVAGAAGQFVFLPGGRVDGQLNVSFRSSVSSLQMPVQVSGTLPDLIAVSRK